jgi:uncharacterized membrane protein YozB (DUF420 family)/cytochrome oxidase Cu insertion factor (SCO1/SenC/PrrC family)
VLPIGNFTLTERSGREIQASELLGKVWVASFIFTRCGGPCPHVTATMETLQTDFAGAADVRLVTFTVDPEFDTPEVLQKYADAHGADPDRWLFLTGQQSDVYRILHGGFHVGAEKDPAAPAAQAVTHDTHLAVVDQRGRVRGYYAGLAEGQDPESAQDFELVVRRLREKVCALRYEMIFPPLNAGLNGAAGVLLLLGFAVIRLRAVRTHAACMLSALAVSAVFLASYLYYHIVVRHGVPTTFAGQWPDAAAWVGGVYYAVLGSHTLLAVVTAPLALYTAYLGLRGRLLRHKWLARWTLPIWLYVSATGVVVYWMLYRLY